MPEKALFDEWPDRYDRWFTTPIGKVVRRVEAELINEMLDPQPGEIILDAGCGTGVFTADLLAAGAQVVGLDISRPMLESALKKTAGKAFFAVQGDICSLPFGESRFDRVVSITALEFIADARKAVHELFRVTRPGGRLVVATLNSLSQWAARRQARTSAGERHILQDAFYRSPDDLRNLSAVPGIVKTAVHFQKDDDPALAEIAEDLGRRQNLNTGAFVAVSWRKPG